MKEECLICKAPLEYLQEDVLMECAICHKKEMSKARCINGHYVCNACHSSDMAEVLSVCLSETGKNPAAILEKLMDLPTCHMHGPEHHVMIGAALLTAYRNAGGELDLYKALCEMRSRGSAVPGGICGFWGTCGAGVSTGIFISIVTGATPLTQESWGLANRMTARTLSRIGAVGGPRCCKRNGYLAMEEAVAFVKENLGVCMELEELRCTRSQRNNQCKGTDCPFHV